MPESFNVGDAYIELRLRQENLQRDSQKMQEALRDQEGQLQAVAKKAEDAGDKLNNAFGGKLVELAARGVAAMGAVELGLGAANVAADLFAGNIEDAAAGLEQLPAGIGPVVRQLKDLLGTLTGIQEETEAWQRATENLEQAQRARYETSMRNLRAEENAVMARLKIEQQIALLGTADGDEAARLKQEFDAQNRINEAKRAALELDRKAQELALGDAGDEASKRSDRINELEKQIADRKLAVRGITNPGGINDKRVQNYRDATAALENELDSLKKLQQAHADRIQAFKREADLILEQIPLLEKLGEIEKRALERSIENRKTEEQQREAEKRIRDAEREAQEKMRIAEKEAAEKKRLAREAHEEEMRMIREAASESQRQLQRNLEITQRINDLKASIRQRQLRLEGRDLEAEIDQINEQAKKARDEAASAEEQRLIEKERRQRIQEVIRRAEAGLGGGSDPRAGISSLVSAVNNLQSAALKREDPAMAQRREQLAVAKAIAAGVDGVKKGVEKLDKPAQPAVKP